MTAFLLYSDRVRKVVGSDANPNAIQAAEQNIAWLTDEEALAQRLRAIDAYRTPDGRLKGVYQQRCRLMFAEAAKIRLPLEVHQGDATRIGQTLAAMDGNVAVVTDPPYRCSNEQREEQEAPTHVPWPLRSFLQQVATAANVFADRLLLEEASCPSPPAVTLQRASSAW